MEFSAEVEYVVGALDESEARQNAKSGNTLQQNVNVIHDGPNTQVVRREIKQIQKI